MHIPFCRQSCHYCNFHFTTSLRYKDEMIKALIKEALDETGYLQGETINTIYFGGGTPSLLEISELRSILSVIYKNYKVDEQAEITLEANPDDIDADSLKGWHETGINRLSIGIQSFFEEELVWMNRAHTAREAVNNVQLAIKEFDNITIDLIYGSPLLTDEMWKQNVDRAVNLGIPHLSCYALTVEEKTSLYKMIHTNKSFDVDPDKQARQFLLLMQWLEEKGYEHYEVSNFAKPGYRSRHNSSYWKSDKYLGLGPSAHSFNGIERRWNIANNQIYIRSIQNNTLSRETEVLTSSQMLNEYLMISLRTREGIDISKIESIWGDEEAGRIAQLITRYINSNLVNLKNAHYQLTNQGMLMADGIAANLFK